jgi:hypothetical protein
MRDVRIGAAHCSSHGRRLLAGVRVATSLATLANTAANQTRRRDLNNHQSDPGSPLNRPGPQISAPC